jgi:hypothetical protein
MISSEKEHEAQKGEERRKRAERPAASSVIANWSGGADGVGKVVLAGARDIHCKAEISRSHT